VFLQLATQIKDQALYKVIQRPAMAPSSPKPVEIAEDVGPGDVANYGLALDGDQQAEFEVEEEQVGWTRGGFY
jgi:hypothetical protein